MKKEIPIKIPLDFVEGTECLANEVPWQVPDSIFKEDEVLDEKDFVLEVGTGGSTLFFARRCDVMAIETSQEWGKVVMQALHSQETSNFVLYEVIPNEDDICARIELMNTSKVSVFSVDTQGGYNRSRILNAFLSKGISPALKMIVLDNYSHEGLFPDHHDKLVIDSTDWEVFTYNHERWAGSGTRLYIKKTQYE